MLLPKHNISCPETFETKRVNDAGECADKANASVHWIGKHKPKCPAARAGAQHGRAQRRAAAPLAPAGAGTPRSFPASPARPDHAASSMQVLSYGGRWTGMHCSLAMNALPPGVDSNPGCPTLRLGKPASLQVGSREKDHESAQMTA